VINPRANLGFFEWEESFVASFILEPSLMLCGDGEGRVWAPVCVCSSAEGWEQPPFPGCITVHRWSEGYRGQ